MLGREVTWEHLSCQYILPIEKSVKEFAENSNLRWTLWHQDSTYSFVSRDETPFCRSVQISVYEDAQGVFVAFVPDLYKKNADNKKRYVCAQIPISLIRRLYLPPPPLTERDITVLVSKIKCELFTSWENTYFITPDMLNTEI